MNPEAQGVGGLWGYTWPSDGEARKLTRASEKKFITLKKL